MTPMRGDSVKISGIPAGDPRHSLNGRSGRVESVYADPHMPTGAPLPPRPEIGEALGCLIDLGGGEMARVSAAFLSVTVRAG